MRRFPILFAAVIYLLTLSCSPSVRMTATWINKPKVDSLKPHVKTVFVAVLASDPEVKSILESDLAKAGAKRGLTIIKSGDAFPPVAVRDKPPTKEQILEKIRQLGCQAIFTLALIDQKSETYYVPASTTQVYAPYPAYGYYGTFGSYYGYSSFVYSPGYYSTDKTYYLESNLYDASTEALLMSMQSKAENPGSIEKASRSYTEALVDELQNHGLLMKK